MWGSDTARAAEIFLRFGLLPNRRRALVHWLESGTARQGRSMRIDQRAAAGCGFDAEVRVTVLHNCINGKV